MKKFIVALALPIAIFALAFSFNTAEAQVCPVGFICTPISNVTGSISLSLSQKSSRVSGLSGQTVEFAIYKLQANNSDMTVANIAFDFSNRLWLYADRLVLKDEFNNVIGSADLNSANFIEITPAADYRLSIVPNNFIVKSGQLRYITASITFKNNLDALGVNFSVLQTAVRSVDSMGISNTQTVNNSATLRSALFLLPLTSPCLPGYLSNGYTCLLFTASSSPTVSNTSAQVTQEIKSSVNGPTIAAAVTYKFTVTASSRPIYISVNPNIALATSSNPYSASSSISILEPMAAFPGDSRDYFIIPAEASRTFTYSGLIIPSLPQVQTYRLSIIGIFYGTDPTWLQSGKITSGLAGLTSAAVLGGTSTTINCPVGYVCTPYISNSSAVITQEIKSANGSTVAVAVSYKFTINAPSQSIYISTIPSVALATSSIPYISSGSAIYNREFIPAMAGDTANYFIIPAGVSRSFVYSGIIDGHYAPVMDRRLSITGMHYGTSPSSLEGNLITSGLEALTAHAVMGGTGTTVNCPAGFVCSPYVSNTSVTTLQAVVAPSGGSFVSMTSSYKFTVSAPSQTIYINRNPAVTLATSTSGGEGAFRTTGLFTPNTVAGDSSLYIIVPAGTSRQVEFVGVQNNSGPVQTVRLSIVGVKYGTDRLQFNDTITSGVAPLTQTTVLGGTTPNVCPAGYICTPPGVAVTCPAGYTCTPATITTCPTGYTCYMYSKIETLSLSPSPLNKTVQLGQSLNQVFVVNSIPAGANGAWSIWNVAKGSLPSGVLLSQYGAFSGLLSGTPTTPGTYNFMIQGYNPVNNLSAYAWVYLTVLANPSPSVVPVYPLIASCSAKTFNSGVPGASWSASVSGGKSPYSYSWSVYNDVANYGEGSTASYAFMVSYNSAGTKQAVVRVTDAAGGSATASCSTTIPSYTSSTPYPSPAPTQAPIPTASLTVQGTHNFTFTAGQTANYAWNSTNADTFYSTYTSNNGPMCGSGGNWSANTANGITSSLMSNSAVGCTWRVTYTAKNSVTGYSASDTITVSVVSATPSSTPMPVTFTGSSISASIGSWFSSMFGQ